MSSKRRLRASGCTVKKRFATEVDAQAHAANVFHYHGSDQRPYLCTWGQHWHVTAGYKPGMHANKSRGKTRLYRGTR